jgi:hypothetical protein
MDSCHRSVSDKYDVIECVDCCVEKEGDFFEHLLLAAVVPEWIIQSHAFLLFCFN